MVNRMLKKQLYRDLLKAGILLGFGFFFAGLMFSLGFIINYVTPFSYNLKETQVIYPDMCLGDTTGVLTYFRTVRPNSGWEATFSDELYRLEDNRWIETRIHRSVTTFMQPTEGGFFDIEWNRPLEEGIYAVSRKVEINPYFGVHKTQVEPIGDYVFSVRNCHG